ncbi:MAG: hypothetical protein OXT09_34780 [Myxococcales bacterium]|nr:hypothetical protein [Myxococcales bacterium]
MLAKVAAALKADLLVVVTATMVVHGIKYGHGDRYLHLEAVVLDRHGRQVAGAFSRGAMRFDEADTPNLYRAHFQAYGSLVDDLVASLVDPGHVAREAQRRGPGVQNSDGSARELAAPSAPLTEAPPPPAIAPAPVQAPTPQAPQPAAAPATPTVPTQAAPAPPAPATNEGIEPAADPP